MKKILGFLLLVVLAVSTLTLAACGDSESSKRRLVDTGKKYFASGKYREASIIFRKALEKDGRFGDAWYNLGETSLRLGNYGEALGAFRRASELMPDNHEASAKLGDLLLAVYIADRNRYKSFLSELDELGGRVLKRAPHSFEGLRMKAYVAVANQKYDEAADLFAKALAVKPTHQSTSLAYVQTLSNAGRAGEGEKVALDFIAKDKTYGPMYDFLYVLRIREKKIPEAEGILTQKIQNNPKQPIYRLELALHYLRAQNRDAMLKALDSITSNKSEFPTGRSLVGDFYLRIGDMDAAYKQYEQGSVEQPPMKALYQKKMVEVLATQGRQQEAIQLAQKVTQENPTDDQAKAIRASLRLRGGDRKELDTAINEFQNVISRMPDNAVIRYNYGEALLAKGEIDQARVQFEEAVKIRSTFLAPLQALGRIHLAKREYPKTLERADLVLKQSPGNISARLLRASALMGNKDYKSSRSELTELVTKVPDLKDAQYLLAMLDFAEKHYPEAEKNFRALWDGNPPDQRGLFGLAEVYMSTDRPPMARQILQTALAGKPANANMIRLAIANVAVRTNSYDEASGIYQQLIKEMPRSQDMWIRLGETYKRAGKYDEAIKAFETAKNINPQELAPWLEMAVVLEVTNQKDKLRPLYAEILKRSPDNAVALNNMAFILADAGVELDQALSYAQKAKQKLPGHPDVADTLGWVYIKKNLSDEAIKIFRDLLVLKPQHVTWRYHLAMALFQKGDRLNARLELEKALKNGPTKDEDKKIRELLGRIG